MKGERRHGRRILVSGIFWGICLGFVGCAPHGGNAPSEAPIPRELRMTTLPPYVIEPPDILIIRTIRDVPKPPYRIQPLDALAVHVTGAPEPIRGLFSVDPDGTINLGIGFGSVQVADKTIAEAKDEVQKHLSKIVKMPTVELSLGQSRAMQQIQGEHLVRMDGMIGLGVYGSVYVAGMTLDQARQTIEKHLSEFLLKPQISLDIYSYNSKWYYLIQERAGYGQTVLRLPITGKDTVLDAISMMMGTTMFSSNKYMWLSRPNGQDPNKMQIFPINWPALVRGGSPATNYQLMPGDRLYVSANRLMLAQNRLMQTLMPLETSLGFTLLGSSTVTSIENLIRLIQTPTFIGGGLFR